MGRKKRNTRQKELIRHELEGIDSMFNAEDLHGRALRRDPRIGLATVYRFLLEAKDNGELYTYTCDRKTVYSRVKRSHCHFECEKTGKVIHFEIDNLDFLKDKIPGTISSFQLEVKGICKRCG